jgi:hypothetical protein
MESTKASAELESQSSPSVTRLFEARMMPGMRTPSNLSFQAIHAYQSPFFASSRILDSGGSGRGFITAAGETPTMTSAMPALELPRAADAHLPHHPAMITASDADEPDFQDFTAALLTMRKSGARLRARDFGGDDVQRNLFANQEAAASLVPSPGNDSSMRADVIHILNSPATPAMAVKPVAPSGAQAARSQLTDRSSSEDFDVSAVESRGADTSLLHHHHALQPLDSSVLGSGGGRISADATPDSDYQQLMRAADVMKAARGHEVQGGATTPPPPAAPDGDAVQTDTTVTLNSDPLHAYGVLRGTGTGMEQGRGGFGRGRGGFVAGGVRLPARPSAHAHSPSAAGRGRFGGNSPAMSVGDLPNTRGLQVQWPASTADGHGLVPTNLFGRDESDVLAQFRDFVRQVPDSKVEERCKSLLLALRESQGTGYALWVNPRGLFMRVRVMAIVDARSESPRVRINVRDNECVFATFGELFRDQRGLQYKAYSDVPDSERPLSLADEMYKYMQVVDDKARQLDDEAAASSPGVRRGLNTSEGSVDEAGEPPDGGDGGGSEGFGYSQVSNFPGRPVFRPTPKFDSSKIVHFTGLCEVAPREQYQKRAEPWIRRMLMTLKAQNIPMESYVQCALLCVDSTAVAQRYQSEEMKRPDYPANWFYDEAEYPPRPESLRFRHFAQWLIRTFTDDAVTEEQRAKFESLRQKHNQSVFIFNDSFNYERALLNELNMASYLACDLQVAPSMWDISMDPENPWMIVEDARDTLRYIGALTDPLRDSVSSWHTNELVKRQLASTMGGQRAHIPLTQVQEAAIKFERVTRLKSGFPQGPQVGSLGHATRAPLAITNGPRGWNASSRMRVRAPSPPARFRVHNIESEPDEVEEIDADGTDLERLYATMSQEGKVAWTRAQLKSLMDKKLCFKCAKPGHRAPDCPNTAVNPKTFRFSNLVEITSFDEENEDLFYALHEFGDLENQGGTGNGSASR